ncbi:MAG TPA: hypothetical protein PK492_10200, partial [Chitinophagaceae bacterium]|nr:hypothetical protein [Chitinophagaceae bacterium]
RGDENREQLQRIYGTIWNSEEELKAYLDRIEEAKKRDHRELGPRLGLFSIQHDSVGSGLILWHPKGALVRHIIETYLKDEDLQSSYRHYRFFPQPSRRVRKNSAFYSQSVY